MFGDVVSNDKGWERKKLCDVCDKITDGTHDTPKRLTKGVKFITGKHIKPGFIDYENSDYVDNEIHKEIYKRCNPEFGDILYTNIGANLATAAMNTVFYEFSMKNVALLKINKQIINGYFTQYYLNDNEEKNRIVTNVGKGGAQKFLSLKLIETIPIPLPPLSLQQKFAARITAIESQKDQVKQQISDLQTLFDSRMQYYFD
jgi:type I restriction enzyme S subunit